jgi:hypothetical protein
VDQEVRDLLELAFVEVVFGVAATSRNSSTVTRLAKLLGS